MSFIQPMFAGSWITSQQLAVSLSQYLLTSTAEITYLSILDADLIYLSKSAASTTYLTIASAAAVYLTITAAAAIYVTLTYLTTNYLTASTCYATFMSFTTFNYNVPQLSSITCVITPGNPYIPGGTTLVMYVTHARGLSYIHVPWHSYTYLVISSLNWMIPDSVFSTFNKFADVNKHYSISYGAIGQTGNCRLQAGVGVPGYANMLSLSSSPTPGAGVSAGTWVVNPFILEYQSTL